MVWTLSFSSWKSNVGLGSDTEQFAQAGSKILWSGAGIQIASKNNLHLHFFPLSSKALTILHLAYEMWMDIKGDLLY